MCPVREHTVLLDGLDDGLAGLRRLWAHPDRKRRFMAELGVPVELAVLRTLHAVEVGGSGDTDAGDTEKVSVSEVADLLQVSASTASRLLDQAVQSGYVIREACDEDRRRASLLLTDDGCALLERARDVRRSLLAEVTAEWPDHEIVELTRLLARLQHDIRRIES
jgi:DNA-binding MarR family transcriptional regulator